MTPQTGPSSSRADPQPITNHTFDPGDIPYHNNSGSEHMVEDQPSIYMVTGAADPMRTTEVLKQKMLLKEWALTLGPSVRRNDSLEVSWNKEEPWFLTAIYGSPNPTIRRDLWYMLEEIANLTIGLWCIGGDFNAIKYAQDSGGSSNLSSDTNKFIDCMCNCGMMEVEFFGPPFTWQRGHIKRRLDRVLNNFEWTQLFQAAGVKHLPKLKSDHLPILIDFQHTIQDNSNKPFRLLAPWLLHDDYSNLYGCGEALLPKVKQKNSSSNTWQGIVKIWNDFTPHLIWRIGDDKEVAFWTDQWIA
ncbi:hypothetical protein Ahy_A08g039223 [Arachis hypogaea]|uniref:Endonuclease/exonuclease/phosphatase domain-containing protein n=1 Tax=Arachis hypogaea TaxID=3818 RepID=A0A445BVV3_ARAHY|nr:hypothetical protein Ahy_A08g039223 [Arachis hypogaea]